MGIPIHRKMFFILIYTYHFNKISIYGYVYKDKPIFFY